MIFDTQYAVERLFKDDWAGSIHYSNTEKHPNTTSWIYVDVEPIFVKPEAMSSMCATETSLIYVTCYASNKVEASKVADEVISFLQGEHIGKGAVGNYRPVGRGEVFAGSFFYKISFPITVLETY